jgi:hypothetical protein
MLTLSFEVCVAFRRLKLQLASECLEGSRLHLCGICNFGVLCPVHICSTSYFVAFLFRRIEAHVVRVLA